MRVAPPLAGKTSSPSSLHTRQTHTGATETSEHKTRREDAEGEKTVQNLILDASENARNFIYALVKDEQSPFDATAAMW